MSDFIDLHVHTTASDGTLTPEQVVQLAKQTGLAALAITDHDTTAGVPEALETGRELEIEVIAGVELSVVHERCGSLHILGYYIDPRHPDLGEKLEAMRDGRDERNLEILEKLRQLGMQLDLHKVKARAGGQVIGRPHMAQELLALGHVSSIKEAFDRFLARGKPAYAERKRMTPPEAIQRIRNASGVAVLAHPGLLPLATDALETELAELAEQGIQGLEVHYPEHSPADTRRFLELAKKHNLVITGGTDFHGDNKPDIKLGQNQVPLELLENLRAKRQIPSPHAGEG